MTAQTTRERQEALRARRAMLGLTEVRGLYLPPDLHPDIKALARAMVERLERASAKRVRSSLGTNEGGG